MKLLHKCLPLTILTAILSIGLHAQTYVFAQLQGSPIINTTGWNMTGSAAIGDTPGDADGFSNEVILTPNIGNTSGAIFYGQPINPSLCVKWMVDFDFRIFDGNSADGIAFCFLDVPPAGFVPGGGVGIPNASNGLKVIFDTFNNSVNGVDCGGQNPEIQIYNGVGYGNTGECLPGIVRVTNNNGNLNFIRSDTNYNHARIEYNSGNVTVFVNGTQWLTAFSPVNFSGYMGFTSSTGGSNDRHSIKNVTIYTEQAPSNAGPDVAYCTGGNVQIGTTPNPAYIYSWSPPAGLSATNVANPTASPTNAGNAPVVQQYTVTTTLANNPGVCPTTDVVNVTVNPVPTSTFTVSTDTTCVNAPVTVTYTGNMTATATYTWNFNGGTVISGSGRGPYQISWPAQGNYQITLSVSQYGCSSTVGTQNVQVYSIPTSGFTLPQELCTDAEGNFTYTGTGSAAAAYNWNFDGGTVVTGTDQGPFNVKWATPGVKQVSLAVTENGCVSPTFTDSITIHPYPVTNFTLPTAMCAGDTVHVQYTGTPLPAGGTGYVMYYNWSGGTYIIDPADPGNQFFWTAATPGSYDIWSTVNIHGCQSDTVTQSITVHPVPTAAFTATPQACTGDNVLLTYTGTGSAAATYNWVTAPGTVQAGTGQGPLTVTYATPGTHNILLTVTENGCVSPTDTVPVTIHAIPTSTFNVAAGICEGQTTPLTYTGTGSAGATFDWNFGGVEVVSGTGMGPYVLGDANLGNFTITLQVTENNCVSPVTSHNFIVLPSPTVDFSATPLIGCNPLPVQFTNNTPAQPGITYQWNFGNGNTSTSENPLHIYADAGTFTVTLIATNGFGCADTATKVAYVKVTPQPVAGFSVSPPKVTMDNPTIHVTDNSQFAQTWSYTMGDGGAYGIPSPFHTYTASGDYWIVQTVSNSLGCADTATQLVQVIPSTNVFVPNAFTPGNADGLNDTWTPIISYLTEYQLLVFDRWGSVVFETYDVYEGWNGNYRNKDKAMKQDVYAYIIRFTELSGKTRTVSGHVTLVR